jgi:hypothetical protein
MPRAGSIKFPLRMRRASCSISEDLKICSIPQRVELRVIVNHLQQPRSCSRHLRMYVLEVFQRGIGLTDDGVSAGGIVANSEVTGVPRQNLILGDRWLEVW